MENVFFSLGSNLGDRENNLSETIIRLEEYIAKVQKSSSIWETEPWGFQSADKFLNMVVSIETDLSPSDVLNIILEIEKQMGRKRRSTEYESRVIDIDILLFGKIKMSETALIIPHPHLHKRKFVLSPLNEIEPHLVHPVLMKTMSELLSKCKDRGVVTKWRLT